MESVRRHGKVPTMDTNELRAAISLLLTEMEEQPEDMHEAHLKLQELLDQLRATGAELPQDLVDLERRMATEVEGVSPDKA